MTEQDKKRLADISNGLHHNMSQLKQARQNGSEPVFIIPERCKAWPKN